MNGFKTPSRGMAAAITLWLMAMFTLSYLLPVLKVDWLQPALEFDEALKQTLLVLLVGSVGYYIGTTRSSEEKNDTIRQQAATAAVIAGAPLVVEPPGAAPVPPATPTTTERNSP